MRKISRLLCIFFILGIIPQTAVSQQLIVNPISNPYRFSYHDAFNLRWIQAKHINVYIQVEVYKKAGGLVLSYNSTTLNYNGQSHYQGWRDLLVENVRFIDIVDQSWYEKNNTLPPGDYRLCVKLKCSSNDCDGQGLSIIPADMQSCQNFKIQSTTPLMLNYPMHEMQIATIRPQFIWIPPHPVSQNVTYQIKLVELEVGQSIEEALSRNVPVILKGAIQSNSIPFPSDIDALEWNRWYVWQVEAWLGESKLAWSEVWKFMPIPNQEEQRTENLQFIKLDRAPISTINVEGVLRLDVLSETKQEGNLLKIEIWSENEKQKLGDFEHKLSYGRNLISQPLNGIGLKGNREYIVKVYQDNQKMKQLRIKWFFKR